MPSYTVLFQGDSITDSGRTGRSEDNLGTGYPAMIAARLACDRPEVEWNFINRGINGHRVVDLYSRWKVDCLNLHPDVVSILIGVNDTWHHFMLNNGVEVPRYARIYRELLEWTRRELPKVKLVLIDPFLCPEVEDRRKMVDDVAARQKVVAELAAEFGAIHIKAQELFDRASRNVPQSRWSEDGVHPTPAGHQLLADAWIKATSGLFCS